jgi:hypothetical protein
MKINFKYSGQYNMALEGAFAIPSSRIDKAILDMENFWKNNYSKIKEELFNITGLIFHDIVIDCYINSVTSFSDPLSIKIDKAKVMENTLVHELIHVLLTQNYELGIKKQWDSFMKKYDEYNILTRSHIAVHAIHYALAKKIFPDRIHEIIHATNHPDYVVAWNIVLDKEPENIIKEIFKK